MPFEITKTFVVKALPADVWAFLVDPQRVARCMPGAAITDKLAENTYAGTMTVKVGPVQASYRGKVVFERLDAAARTAEIVATGQDVRGKGGADLRLRSRLAERGAGETEVTAVSEVNVTGILAQMGRGMVEDVGDQMFQIFSQRMRKELEATETATVTTNQTSAGTAPPPFDSAPLRSGRTEGETANRTPTANPVPPASVHPERRASEAGAESKGPEPLDVGALGARVARRAATRSLGAPTPLWLSLILAVAVVYLLLRS
ncbi:MAG: SRPBCC family protein [Anaeromyxobacteraceae bacterium]